jgi:hypothetical protein
MRTLWPTTSTSRKWHAQRPQRTGHREPAVVSARQAEVDKYILDELALTMMYEGHRFYDLMRYAKFWNKPAFLGETISKRKGAENVDASLAGRLASEAGWYLPLPTR